jgi:hypothetical protein
MPSNKVNIISNQLSVLVTNNDLTTASTLVSAKTDRKCIVASSESLTSINTVSDNSSKLHHKQSSSHNDSSAATMTTSSPHESVSSKASSSDHSANVNSNFKTFKNAQVLNSPQQKIYHQQQQHHNLPEVVNPYKTLPHNGNYRQNYVDFSQQNDSNSAITRAPIQKQQQQQQHRKLSIMDQKQLNLPVNELFKRYELKRQAAAGSLSSSGSLTDLNTVAGGQQQTTVQQPAGAANGNNQHISTFITSPRLNRINLMSTGGAANQIPDYFFKDEKEHKKFLASNGGKQMLNLNLTHVDIS